MIYKKIKKNNHLEATVVKHLFMANRKESLRLLVKYFFEKTNWIRKPVLSPLLFSCKKISTEVISVEH
jgi:hypothetical protein